MSFITNFWYDIQNDEIYRKKVFFWIFVVLGLSTVISLLIWVNLREFGNNGDGGAPTVPQVSFLDTQQVTSSSFGDADYIDRAFDSPAAPGAVVAFDGEDIYSINQEQRVIRNGDILAGSPQIDPDVLYPQQDGTLIANSIHQSHIYTGDTFIQAPKRAQWITPVLLENTLGLRTQPGFVYLTPSDTGYALQQATDIGLSQGVKQIANIRIGQDVSFVELRVINQVPYMMLYEFPTRQGRMEIWKIQNAQVEKVRRIANVESVAFGDDGILFNTLLAIPNELTKYELFVLDFKTDLLGQLKPIPLSQALGIQSVRGSVLANRCDLSNRVVYCVVKEDKVEISQDRFKDRVVGYQIDTGAIRNPELQTNISMDRLFVRSDNTIFITGQFEPGVYELILSPDQFNFDA